MSLVDSRVWLAGDEPAAIAIVARRGSAARLAAFALRPAWRGKGRRPETDAGAADAFATAGDSRTVYLR